MAPATCHLPNGQNLTVTPVFGGLYFKSIDLAGHHGAAFPPGWTVVLNSGDDGDDSEDEADSPNEDQRERPRLTPEAPNSRSGTPKSGGRRQYAVHRYTKPTLHNDHLFISSISQPNNNEFKPVTSPSRQIAMMLWATLWWYFHQPEPDRTLHTKASEHTKESGKPKGEWRINISREGVFKGKVVLPKLERMCLIASEDSVVGSEETEKSGENWKRMFVSRKAFWQLDARMYLFTQAPAAGSPFPASTPVHSRPGSPSRAGDGTRDVGGSAANLPSYTPPHGAHFIKPPGNPSNPFQSASHLPTYYPPPPTQFITTNGIIHPLRPKPPRPGETFYTRYVPSVGQYLSFRAANSSAAPHVHNGPVSSPPLSAHLKERHSDSIVSTMQSLNIHACDCELLHKWMNEPRINEFWGCAGEVKVQEAFLQNALKSKHSFPVIGCWDGKPFGYFEIYWVKEDQLGKYAIDVGNYDRGLHVLVGEEEFRGPHRVGIWLSALVHYCWLADNRTERVLMEPRVDNEK
jgi:hypothetical protein